MQRSPWARCVAVTACVVVPIGGAACTLLTGVDRLNETPCIPGQCDASVDRDAGGGDAADARVHADAPAKDVVAARDAREAAAPSDAVSDADAGSSYSETILADLPIAYWRLNETTGTVAHDSSGHGNDATYFMCTLGSPGALLTEAETAAAFDGTTSYVVGPNFRFAGMTSFTVEAWANAASITTTDYHHILTDETQSGDRQGYALFLTDLAELEVERFVDASNQVAFGPTVTAGMFHHVVGTYDGATLTLYYDGLQVGTVADARIAVGTTDPFYVGAAETTKFFDGTIGEVAVYDSALSAARVAAHFHASGR
jgi:concanavalin A-like lectin/glucanase superfamily protein